MQFVLAPDQTLAWTGATREGWRSGRCSSAGCWRLASAEPRGAAIRPRARATRLRDADRGNAGRSAGRWHVTAGSAFRCPSGCPFFPDPDRAVAVRLQHRGFPSASRALHPMAGAVRSTVPSISSATRATGFSAAAAGAAAASTSGLSLLLKGKKQSGKP